MMVKSEPTTNYTSASITNETKTPIAEKPKEVPTYGIITIIIVVLTLYLYIKGRK